MQLGFEREELRRKRQSAKERLDKPEGTGGSERGKESASPLAAGEGRHPVRPKVRESRQVRMEAARQQAGA